MQQLVMATGNAGKLVEMRELLAPLGFQVCAQTDLGVEDIDEPGPGFIENALLKARHAAAVTGLPAIADDSGLVVPALAGAPGVYSARYAGEGATAMENNQKLLAAMSSLPAQQRQAWFICQVVAVTSANDPLPLLAHGRWHGSILQAASGSGGFGYDPLFAPIDMNCSAAELVAETKNAISHRGLAIADLLRQIQQHWSMLSLPPLSLYIHIPWCVRKCPYCDFNSHAVKNEIPQAKYVQALLQDLEADLPQVWGRTVHSIFIGGGTPSLFSAASIADLISGVRARIQVHPGAEITMEANPGTLEHDSFSAYRDAGINRVSLGAQSFSDPHLHALGRIHGNAEILTAVAAIKSGGIDNFNLDLMVGLPNQSRQQALDDLQQGLACGPTHISHYQLTLEPNTQFAHQPPAGLPGDDDLADTQDACASLLASHGFAQYEVSAWAKTGNNHDYQSRHNLNYWRFGDYLGIGAGAHGKITQPAKDVVLRSSKHRHPQAYLEAINSGLFIAAQQQLTHSDLIFEFFLNQLRLKQGVRFEDFSPRTGIDWESVQPLVEQGVSAGFFGKPSKQDKYLRCTGKGWQYLNAVQALFLSE